MDGYGNALQKAAILSILRERLTTRRNIGFDCSTRSRKFRVMVLRSGRQALEARPPDFRRSNAARASQLAENAVLGRQRQGVLEELHCASGSVGHERRPVRYGSNPGAPKEMGSARAHAQPPGRSSDQVRKFDSQKLNGSSRTDDDAVRSSGDLPHKLH